MFLEELQSFLNEIAHVLVLLLRVVDLVPDVDFITSDTQAYRYDA